MSNTNPPEGPQGVHGPEYLEQGGGAPVRPARTGGSRKPALIAGGAIAGLLLVGGGIWAATWYLGTGAQPAEALPASTLGYVSIDLDPSGAQKIEAVKTLNKFPAFKDKLDLSTTDDVRKKIFEEIQGTGACPDLDYGDDIEPWLGDRAALAAVDTGADQPSPVFVVQVKDADKADAGLKKIQDCNDSSDSTDGAEPSGGWAINGDWAVIAETDKIAQGVVDDAEKSSLSDDADYQKWTDAVGDPGIVSMYAAPEAGDFLAKNLADMTGMFGGSASSIASSCTVEPNADPGTVPTCGDTGTVTSESNTPMPSQLADALKDFKGMAATIRFNDGALELEAAGDPGVSQKNLYAGDQGDDVVATLPADTAAAIGVGFRDGWFTDFVDQMASYSGGQTTAAQLMSQMARASGLDLPADAETLAGDSVAVSVGSDFDPETIFGSGDPSSIPVAAKVKGDPEAINGVLDKVRGQMGTEESSVLQSDSEGDMIAIGPDSDYRSQVLKGGTLGDSPVFSDVVREADKATALFYVNFDAGDGWLTKLAADNQEAVDNLEPLEGLGISAWQEDGTAHTVVRLTTN